MTDSDAVLAANLEFYRAFTTRDLAAMDAIWARQAPVACIHPGWPALADRDAVIESWRGILSNPEAPRIVCYDDDEGGVLQTRTMVEGEEIFAARRLRQFFRDEAPLRA